MKEEVEMDSSLPTTFHPVTVNVQASNRHDAVRWIRDALPAPAEGVDWFVTTVAKRGPTPIPVVSVLHHTTGDDERSTFAVVFGDGHTTTLHADSYADAERKAIRLRATNGWDPVPWPDGVHTCGTVMEDTGSVLYCPRCQSEAAPSGTRERAIPIH